MVMPLFTAGNPAAAADLNTLADQIDQNVSDIATNLAALNQSKTLEFALTALEDIAARDVVAYVPATASADVLDCLAYTGGNSSIGGGSNIYGVGQSFTVPDLINRISSFKLVLSKGTATTGAIVVKLFRGSINNGTELFSQVVNVSTLAAGYTYATVTFTPGTPIEVSFGEQLYIRVESNGGMDGYVAWRYVASDSYSGGSYLYDNDIGTRNYTTQNYDLAFSIQGYRAAAGIVKGDASDATRARVLGFAQAAIAKDASGDIQPFGELAGFSLADSYIGEKIYLSDTAGAIATTPGTVTRELGRCISAAKIIISL